MPFSRKVREVALVKSGRYCCICSRHAGRNVEVHHIVQEADGGSNDLENAIVLCFDCHADVGHYNSRHPRGTKYTSSELRKHRDGWWQYRESLDTKLYPQSSESPRPVKLPSGYDISFVEKEVGTLWSNFQNYPVQVEIVRFKGSLIAKHTIYKDSSSPNFYELYQLANGRHIVYHRYIHRADYECARLVGANLDIDPDPSLTLEEVQSNFPALATKAGLSKVRTLQL